MIDPGPSRALAEAAARAQEMMHAYQPGYETQDDQIRSAILARPEPSTDPMSVAAPEGSYFIGLDSSGQKFYSRDGGFGIVGGKLTWSDGSAVLGYPAKAAAGAAPQRLVADPVDAALGRIADPRVEADGAVVYSRSSIDPKTGKSVPEKVVVGTVALARFPAGTALGRITANRVSAPAGIAPTTASPGADAFGKLAVKMRDVGSIDFNAGLNQMREAYLALDAMSADARVEDHTAHVAMDLIK
jgi:flagellar basal body rod protein FlgG